jgi:ABC-type branched-subunit amino acid transport system ATPase component/ABC-type branched-subunit amino acid transport system permease subunit
MAHDRSRRGGSAADETPPRNYLADLPRWRRAGPWAAAVAFFVGYLFFLANSFWLGVMASGLALSLIFLSFVIVTGLGGMVSLAQATFVTASALSTGLLIHRYHLAFVTAAAVAVVISVLIGVVVAVPALRLGGLPLALATLALAFLGDQVLFAWNWLRNGQAGWSIPRPSLGPFHLSDNRTLAVFLLILVGVVALLIRNLQRSAWGRSIAAVRSSEIAASTSGVSSLRTKLGVFALSAAVAGIGGVMYASFQQSVTNQTTLATDGLLWLATVVLFGIRRPAAAALAGIVAAASPVLLRSGFHWPSYIPSFLSWNGTSSSFIPAILFGIGAVQLARDPDGILAIAAAQNHARRMKRAARRSAGPSTIESIIDDEAVAIVAETQRHERELVAAGAIRAHLAPATETPEDAATLALRQVHAGYGDAEVLHGIDLAVRAGEITALLGANGSGKSTLCSTISGLVPAAGGSILLNGNDITSLGAHRRARSGILVAPESRGIFPGLSVEENLMLRLRDEADRKDVYARFPLLGERRRLLAGSLSGGEQQMLTLAPVLINPPKVVVTDEPTLGLAPLVVVRVMEIFEELRALGSAILLVEEKVRDVIKVADRVAFLELGHIVWAGPRAEIDDDRLVAAYLGHQLAPGGRPGASVPPSELGS